MPEQCISAWIGTHLIINCVIKKLIFIWTKFTLSWNVVLLLTSRGALSQTFKMKFYGPFLLKCQMTSLKNAWRISIGGGCSFPAVAIGLLSARTDAGVVQHDRSCECEMLTAVALNNWSDVFYSCYEFIYFFSTWKFLNLHELFMSAQSHLHHSSPAFRLAHEGLRNKMISLKLTKLNCMEITDFFHAIMVHVSL